MLVSLVTPLQYQISATLIFETPLSSESNSLQLVEWDNPIFVQFNFGTVFLGYSNNRKYITVVSKKFC